jgi:tRNA threonylcarbamoyladenosine biosynthesis protein TsaB
MNIFIDTALTGCNIALFDETAVMAKIQHPIDRGHAEAILPLFQQLMDDVGRSPQDVNFIYCNVGPGSFTGLRVGLAVAQFMGFSLQKPVHGITSFQAFSCGVGDSCNRMVLVETKRSDYYCQIMDGHHKPLMEAQSMSSTDIKDLIEQYDISLITGDAINRFESEVDLNLDFINQSMINIEKTVQFIQSGKHDLFPPEAFYIRDADTSQPKIKPIHSI